jgi:hypothetical protein
MHGMKSKRKEEKGKKKTKKNTSVPFCPFVRKRWHHACWQRASRLFASQTSLKSTQTL